MKSFTSLVFIVVAVGLFFWYAKPAWATVTEMQSEISQYHNDLAQTVQANAKYSQLTSAYNAFTTEQLQQVQNFLPAGVDPIDFVVALNALAAQYGSGLTSVTVGTGAATASQNPGRPYSTLPVTFSVSMTYSNFLLFVHDLEHALPPTDITNLSFVAPAAGDVYSFTVGVQTYYLQ